MHMSEMTPEQKIIYGLANSKYITNVGEVVEALRNPDFAKQLLGDHNVDGEDCDHEALSHPEIQEVFDNDETDGFH